MIPVKFQVKLIGHVSEQVTLFVQKEEQTNQGRCSGTKRRRRSRQASGGAQRVHVIVGRHGDKTQPNQLQSQVHHPDQHPEQFPSQGLDYVNGNGGARQKQAPAQDFQEQTNRPHNRNLRQPRRHHDLTQQSPR